MLIKYVTQPPLFSSSLLFSPLLFFISFFYIIQTGVSRKYGGGGANKVVKPVNRVRTLTGKEIELDIEPDYKVFRIKERVEEKEGIPPVQQRLIYGGKQM